MTTYTPEMVRPTAPLLGSRQWLLTPIDQFALRWLIQGTWVFDVNLGAATLKRGLARLLDDYPILCGRVAAGMRVDYAQSGVPFSVEKAMNVRVGDFGVERTDVRRFADRRTPAQIRRGSAPLMTVRLTELEDGCVLAVCCSHACLDGNGFYTMARNLAHAATGRTFPRPVFERPRVTPREVRPRDAVARAARAAGWSKLSILDLLRSALALPGLYDRAFVAHFPPPTLERIKTSLAKESACATLSTNAALLAHIAHCLATLLGLGEESRFQVSLAVDQRGHVTGLPDAYAGNAAAVVATSAIPAGASRAEIAARLHERLEPLRSTPSAELEASDALTREVAARRLPYSAIPIANMLGRQPTLFYTNSFSKFPVYDLDFGDESRPVRPVRAIPHNLGDPIVLWPAPPAIGGVELYFGGVLAGTVKRLANDDPWWADLRRFDA